MSVFKRFTHRDLEAIRVGRFNLGINTSFIVYRLGNTLIDTGPTNQWKYIKPFINEKPIEQILLTHHHEDHAGNAGNIKALTGITPLAPEITIQKLRHSFATPLIQKIIWGSPGAVRADPLPNNISLKTGEPISAIHAPGHAKDMTCFLLPERGWLFSADLYLANRLSMLRSDEHIPTLLDSIKRILDCEFETIICPHRGIVDQGQERLREKYNFILELASNAQHLNNQGHTIQAITDQLLGKETMISILSSYNFSKRNLIQSCLEVAI